MRFNVNATTMTPQLTFAGRRADLRLEAPERHNALGPEDLRALSIALENIERSDAEVAVLRSTGDTFCSGYDLRALREEIRVGSTSGAERAFANVVDSLEKLRVPTICALQGGAYGGGSDLALACDFRVGTPQTVLNVPAARFGLQFYSGGSAPLRRTARRRCCEARVPPGGNARRERIATHRISLPSCRRRRSRRNGRYARVTTRGERQERRTRTQTFAQRDRARDRGHGYDRRCVRSELTVAGDGGAPGPPYASAAKT